MLNQLKDVLGSNDSFYNQVFNAPKSSHPNPVNHPPSAFVVHGAFKCHDVTYS